jgi:hypothetical protein
MNRINNLFFTSLIVLLSLSGCRQISDGSNELALIYPNLEVGKQLLLAPRLQKKYINPVNQF